MSDVISNTESDFRQLPPEWTLRQRLHYLGKLEDKLLQVSHDAVMNDNVHTLKLDEGDFSVEMSFRGVNSIMSTLAKVRNLKRIYKISNGMGGITYLT